MQKPLSSLGTLRNLARMNARKTILPALLACFILAGCQTLEGMQKDFNELAGSIGSKTQKQNAKPVALIGDGACPPISIDPQLDSMSEFYDMEKPSANNEVSRITITGTQSACTRESDYLNMRIDLSFDGALGPKARRTKSDRPFFAYPYFVAVTDENGNELARELFAASVTYETGQDNIQLVETIRQRLPFEDDGTMPPYQVKIGFQLTEEQLFYNASQ